MFTITTNNKGGRRGKTYKKNMPLVYRTHRPASVNLPLLYVYWHQELVRSYSLLLSPYCSHLYSLDHQPLVARFYQPNNVRYWSPTSYCRDLIRVRTFALFVGSSSIRKVEKVDEISEGERDVVRSHSSIIRFRVYFHGAYAAFPFPSLVVCIHLQYLLESRPGYYDSRKNSILGSPFVVYV